MDEGKGKGFGGREMKTGRERVLETLNFEEPDMVPITELGIDPCHVEAIAGSKGLLECYRRLKFDIIIGGASEPEGWKPTPLPDGRFIDEWGRIYRLDHRTRTSIPVDTTIKSLEDWKNHSLPDPEAPGRIEGFKRLVKAVEGGEMLVAGSTRSPFAIAWEIFTPPIFCRLLLEEPRAIARVIDEITDFNVRITRLLIEAGAELIVQAGDIAEKKGPMVSLKYFKSIIFPSLRRETDEAHKRGVKFIKHTDGNVLPLLQGLLEEAHVDGVHSLDPSSGVEIGKVKEMYGDRLILIGNVSVDNLATKSREEVMKETRECLAKACPGGGYILSSSNSWYTDCKLENCLAMVEVGRKYGRYPFRLS
jgi:uroporphyrinogen decarboxylase